MPRRIWQVRGLCAYLKDGHPSQWKKLFELYGDLVMIDPGVVASEGRVSVGSRIQELSSSVLPLAGFVEFCPVGPDSSIDHSELLLPYELVVGERYSPIISSSNGLMRYSLGDVVQVTRLSNNGVPDVEFLGRLDGALSVSGEKMTDLHFREAISTLRDQGFAINGLWAAGFEWADSGPRYSFVWEGFADSKLSTALENLLTQLNVSYRRKRNQKLIAPLAARAVPFGTLPAHSKKLHWLGQSKQEYLYFDSKAANR